MIKTIKKKETFRCSVCKKIREKIQTDKEAKKELEDNYPGYLIEDCELVCDDCYDLPFFKNLRGE